MKDVLIGDNNAFSVARKSSGPPECKYGAVIHSFSIEDPMDIEIQSNWALIASGFQDAIYLYD